MRSWRTSQHGCGSHWSKWAAITDLISDKNRVCCNNDLEQTLTLLHSEWSKEIEPSGQGSTHHPLAVSNPIDKKGSEFMRRSMQGEAPSMPTAAHDPGLLHEQETPLVIEKNWFLDQEIPAGGFVRIQDSSQAWEERVDETRIITTEGLSTCLDPGRGWTITSGGWNFLKKQECWEGHEQALISTIRKETKQTEELEEAGYRSPTWAVLRLAGFLATRGVLRAVEHSILRTCNYLLIQVSVRRN